MGSNTTYDIPVVASGVNAPSVSLINDDAEDRTFEFVSTVSSDRASIYGSADGVNFPPTVNTTPLVTLGGNSPPITLNDRSLKYRAVFSGTGVRSCKVRAGTGCCAGDAGQHFATLALGDFPAGGVVTTQANVDQFAAFTIAQTTPGQVLTFPAPSDPTATYVRWVSNVKADGTSAGLVAFSLYGLLVLPGASTKIVWSGATWVEGCTGTATPTRTLVSAAGKNVLDSDGQSNILGNLNAVVAGSFLSLAAGAGDMALSVDGGGRILADTDGGSINIGNVFASAKAVIVGSVTAAASTTIQAGTAGILIQPAPTGPVTLDSGTTGNVDIGRGLSAKTITIGNAVGATGVGIVTGTAGFGLQTTGAGPVAISSGTTGTVTIDSGTTGAVNLGTGANAKAVTVGSVAGAASLDLRAGTGKLRLINNGNTWEWPTALGAAGTKLTDAAGNGVLSWT